MAWFSGPRAPRAALARGIRREESTRKDSQKAKKVRQEKKGETKGILHAKGPEARRINHITTEQQSN